MRKYLKTIIQFIEEVTCIIDKWVNSWYTSSLFHICLTPWYKILQSSLLSCFHVMLKNMVACFLRFSWFCYHTPPRSEPSLSFISIVSMLLIFDYIPRSFSAVGSLTQKGSCQVCLESSWGGASPAPSVRLPSGPLVLERAKPQQVSAALLKVAHVAFQWIPVGYFKGLSSSLLLPSSSYTDAVCVLWLMVVWPHLPIVWGP